MIFSDEFEINIKDIVEKTEACMVKAVDDSLKRAEALDSKKPRITFSLDGRVLKNLVVMQDYDYYTTNEYGILDLAKDVEDIEILFKYKNKNKPVFFLSVGEENPVSIKIEIENEEIKEILLKNEDKEQELKIIKPNLKDFSLDDYVEQIGYFVYNYLYFQDAAEFYIKQGVDFTKPVNILLGQKYDKKAAYIDYKIIMNDEI